MTAAQRSLVEDNLDLVPMIAGALSRGGYPPDFEYVRTDGYVALIQAALRYDQSHPANASFRTFAARRISGAVLDSIREQRRARGWVRTARAGRAVTVQVLTFERLETLLEDDDGGPVHLGPDPFEATLAAEQRRLIAAAPLTRRQWQVLAHRLRGWLHHEIGRALGFNESRSGELERGGIARVRAYLQRAA